MKILNNLSNTIGFDIIPIVIKGKIEDNKSCEKIKQIRNKIKSITSKNIDFAINYAKDIESSETPRGDTIESKAQNILGITSIATGFIVGFSTLVTPSFLCTKEWLLIIIIILYIFIVLSLLLTILSAFIVLKVGNYFYSQAEIDDIYSYSKHSLLENKKEQLVSLIYSYHHNQNVNNLKATILISSQKWFRNTMILFLILSITIVLIYI